jgi:hypothetical protein
VWGEFKQIEQPEHRRYIRAYWRFLVGWGNPPKRDSVPADVGTRLRELAKEEVLAYRKQARDQGGAKVITVIIEPLPPAA